MPYYEHRENTDHCTGIFFTLLRAGHVGRGEGGGEGGKWQENGRRKKKIEKTAL
jgi:hypothetical protein